jgi:hypothetical protein
LGGEEVPEVVKVVVVLLVHEVAEQAHAQDGKDVVGQNEDHNDTEDRLHYYFDCVDDQLDVLEAFDDLENAHQSQSS